MTALLIIQQKILTQQLIKIKHAKKTNAPQELHTHIEELIEMFDGFAMVNPKFPTTPNAPNVGPTSTDDFLKNLDVSQKIDFLKDIGINTFTFDGEPTIHSIDDLFSQKKKAKLKGTNLLVQLDAYFLANYPKPPVKTPKNKPKVQCMPFYNLLPKRWLELD